MPHDEVRHMSEEFSDYMGAAGLDPITGDVEGQGFVKLDAVDDEAINGALEAIIKVDPEIGRLAANLIVKYRREYAAEDDDGPADESDEPATTLPADLPPEDPVVGEDLESYLKLPVQLIAEPGEIAVLCGAIKKVSEIADTGKIETVTGPGEMGQVVPVAPFFIDDRVAGVFCYPTRTKAAWKKVYRGQEPVPMDEVLEREPDPRNGLLWCALVKKGRAHWVLERLTLVLTEEASVEFDDGARTGAADPEPHLEMEQDFSEPAPIELDEDDQEITEETREILDDEPYLELERLNRKLYALEADKAASLKDFGERIKEVKEKTQAQLRYIARAKDQHSLPFDQGPPTESQEVPPAPPEEEISTPPDEDGVVEDESTGNETDGNEQPKATPDDENPSVCGACDGSGYEHENVLCSVCNGERLHPAPRNDGDGRSPLKCFACGQMRPAFSFENFKQVDDENAPPMKGHVCSACRSNDRTVTIGDLG